MGKRKMKIRILLTNIMIAGVLLLSADVAGLPSGVELSPDGILKIEGLNFKPLHFGSGYARSNLATHDNKVLHINDVIKAQTSFKNGQMEISLAPESRSSFTYHAQVEFGATVETHGLMLEVLVPEKCKIIIPGENTDFPEYNPQKINLLWASCKMLSIELPNGKMLTITGDIRSKIIDRRSNGKSAFELRLYFSPAKGDISKSHLKLNFFIKHFAQTTIDLKKIVNTGFRDEKAGDGLGGWTDQGPTNDLRCLKDKTIRVGYVDFNIIDQDSNHGASVIAIGGKRETREVMINVFTEGNYLGLIHATAWTKPGLAGKIKVCYKNGSSQFIEVNSGRDVGNWWEPLNLENGYVAWTGVTNKNRVGLYFSQFHLIRNDPVSITLSGNDSQLWLVPAISLFEKEVNTNALIKEYITAPGEEWIVLESTQDIIPGSPLDFSTQLDAPAGKYGHVVKSSNGHFVFEGKKDTPIRFVGTNLCFSAQYLNKSEADTLAERLSKSGYNAVRIHHHDKYLIDPESSDSLSFDAKNIDKLDYLIYALKKRGIYITTDIYVNRILKSGDNIPEFIPDANGQVKSLLPISVKARENWKLFAKKWLTHHNPYTGMSLLNDPVLYSISLTNENNLYQWWKRYPEIAERYRKLFQDWQKNKYPEREIVTPKQNKRLFEQFIYKLQEKYTLELYYYLKDELKVKALLSDLNMHNKIPLALIRDKLDIVDSHKYHDHPKFPGKPFKYPFSFRQQSAISQLGNEIPGILFGARIFGKPYSVTEYRFCPPNRFRVEGGPLIGAYAALQDWDALYQFAWAHSRKEIIRDSPMGSLNSANDVLTQLSDRLVMLLFRRKDVASAPNGVALQVDTDFWNGSESIDCPERFNQLGLIAKVGVLTGDKKISEVERISRAQAEGTVSLLKHDIEDKRQEMFKTGIARSITGELTLNSREIVLKVDTPRSAVITAVEGSYQVGPLLVTGINIPTTVAACSLDGHKLSDSNKILIFHLTEVCDSGIKFQSVDKMLMLSHGKLPHLLRRSKVKISLKQSGEHFVTVHALKADGGIYGKVETSLSRDKIEFIADNAGFSGGVMVYYIEKQIK